MNGLRNLLLKEQLRLENIINKVKARLETAPKGSLRLSKSHNHIQYYWCKEENKTGYYISNVIIWSWRVNWHKNLMIKKF